MCDLAKISKYVLSAKKELILNSNLLLIKNYGFMTKINTPNQKHLNRKKSDPGQFIFTGKVYDDFSIQLFSYNSEQINENQDINYQDLKPFEDSNINYWLNIHGLSKTDVIVEICRKQKIHDLVIQDILDVNQRPKYQEFEDQYFFTVKSAISDKNSQLITEQISFVFGKNYLISFQEHKTDNFEHIRYRLRNKIGIIRDRTIDYLLFLMLESILDNYFSTLALFEDDIAKLKILESKTQPSPQILNQIERYKKEVSVIKRNIQPIRDFTLMAERQMINFIKKENKKYYFELQDICLTLSENCDSILSNLESKTNLFFSVQTHHMNQVMKTLTIVATIFIPLTFIVGIYGMNFHYMPEIKWHYGYYGVWAVMIVATLIMLTYFKRKKWF